MNENSLNFPSFRPYVRFKASEYTGALSVVWGYPVQSSRFLPGNTKNHGFPWFCVSEVTEFDPFTHLSQTLGKIFNDIHFDVEIDWKIRILMGWIDCLADIETDIGSFLK